MTTLTHEQPLVNPTPAEQAFGDFLAWEADGGDPEGYPGRGWDAIEADDLIDEERLAEMADDFAAEAMVESGCWAW